VRGAKSGVDAELKGVAEVLDGASASGFDEAEATGLAHAGPREAARLVEAESVHAGDILHGLESN
jgi:hypothetical protein